MSWRVSPRLAHAGLVDICPFSCPLSCFHRVLEEKAKNGVLPGLDERSPVPSRCFSSLLLFDSLALEQLCLFYLMHFVSSSVSRYKPKSELRPRSVRGRNAGNRARRLSSRVSRVHENQWRWNVCVVMFFIDCISVSLVRTHNLRVR